MTRLAIILTAILFISTSGRGSSSEDPSNPQSVPPLTFELFDPSGTDNQIATALRDSADKNKQYINFSASLDPIYEDGILIDLIQYSISPDSTSSNIRIKAVSVTTKKEQQLDLMLERGNYKHNIARINLLDSYQNTHSFGFVFPYGIVSHPFLTAFWENYNFGTLHLLQGHALHMGTEEWTPRDTKITFGGGNTRTAGYTYASPASQPFDYPLELTLELVYKGYSNQHEVTLNVLEYKHNRPDNRFASSDLVAGFRTAKLTHNPDGRTKLFVLSKSNSQIQNTYMFNSGEDLSFVLANYEGGVTTDTSNPPPWVKKSTFRATIFGTDINNLYIAGFYFIEINETANTPEEQHFGAFVLPML